MRRNSKKVINCLLVFILSLKQLQHMQKMIELNLIFSSTTKKNSLFYLAPLEVKK